MTSAILLTDVVRGLCLAGLIFGAGQLACAVRARAGAIVHRWRDRQHVARCWRAVRSAR